MCAASTRKPYPSDVTDEEWSLVVSYLTLMKEDAPHERLSAAGAVQRSALCNPLWHCVARDAERPSALACGPSAGARWLAAGCFEALAQDLRAILRLAAGRHEEPTAAIIDSRTLRSTPESGTRAGYDGAKRKRGSKVHMAVDTLGHLLALHVTPADVGDRTAVARLAADIQDATGEASLLPTSIRATPATAAAEAAAAEGIRLEVVKLPEAKRGFVLLPRRWVVERSFAWATRCRRLVKDYERYATTLAGFHVIAFVGYMLKQALALMQGA